VAQTPRSELLRLVPEDVGFCLVVQDLRGHAEALSRSPFAAQLAASAFVKALATAPEMRQLQLADDNLRKYLDIDLVHLRDDIFGDAVVLAYRPGLSGKTEQGLLLVRARDPQLLAGLIDRLNKVQQESGDLRQLEVRRHKSAEYFRREESNRINYYYLRGPVLALATQEEMVQRVIDLDQQAPAREQSRDREGAVALQLRRLGADRGLAALWINPQVFVPEIERQAALARGEDAAVRKAVLAYWKALEGIALSASIHQTDLEIVLAMRAREDRLPLPARKMFGGEAKASQLWKDIPANAVLALAGHIDTSTWAEFLESFLTDESRKDLHAALVRGPGAVLGKDLAKDILPFIGPDWGFYIAPPPSTDKDWFPHITWALRVRPGTSDPPVDRTLWNGLNALAMLAVLAYNSSHPEDGLTIRSISQGGVEVQYLSNVKSFPPGLQPAAALKDGYLVLASSPEAIRGFHARSSAEVPATPAAEVPVLRFSALELRRYLQGRREVLAAHVAEKEHISKEEAGRRLDRLVAGLQPFDRLDLSQRSAPGQFSLILRVRTAQPLRN
jgi:hypothetical protein